MSDFATFFRAWISDPLRVAAIAPSGRALADIMTANLGPGDAPIIELGPGTGVFTRALIARGICESDLVLIEAGSEFAKILKIRHPAAHVHRMDAARLGAYPPLLNDRKAGAVISGLPLLAMNTRKQFAILQASFGLMRPNGAFYQFTYGPRCPVSNAIVERLCLRARKVGATVFNMPPASVYKFTRRPCLRPLDLHPT